MSSDYYTQVARGDVPGQSLVHKFGRNASVGTTLVPICDGGFYRTPKTDATVTLALISDDANDTAAGTGAREITLNYLTSAGVETTATIATNGTTESTGTVTGVWRLLRAWVSASGSYATQSVGSQNGTITIRVSGAGATWATIPEVGTTGFAVAQSLIGAYTIPAGKTGYILSNTYTVESNKTGTCYLFARSGADELVSPYSALRLKNIYSGLANATHIPHKSYEKYTEMTDMIVMGTVSTTGIVSAEFELLLIDNPT